MLASHNLNISRVEVRANDGTINMQGELNGLKMLILRDNSYAFYVHCFAHQLIGGYCKESFLGKGTF